MYRYTKRLPVIVVNEKKKRVEFIVLPPDPKIIKAIENN